MSLLLDSCTMLWLGADSALLSAPAAQAIRESPRIFVSPMSLFELGHKQRLGKLQLPVPAEVWYAELLVTKHLSEIDVTAAIVTRAFQLPLIHRDPIDRFLIATALHLKLKMVSPDPEIKKYPDLEVIW